jgi:hypothetical protein
MTPRSHSESLSPSTGLFALPLLMIGIRSVLVSKKSRLNMLLGGFLLIQLSVSPDIFAVSEILNLVDLETDSYIDASAVRTNGSLESMGKSPTANATLRR